MEREIKFKGFSKELNKWLFGYFMVGLNGESYIINQVEIDKNTKILEYSIVVKESVSQIKESKNGEKIMKGSLGTYIVTRLRVNENKRDELHFICNKYYGHILNSDLSIKIIYCLQLKSSEFLQVYDLIEEWEKIK